MSEKRPFSILNLLLFTTTIAMAVSVYVMSQRVRNAELRTVAAEAKYLELCAKFGYMEPTTEFTTRFLHIQDDSGQTAYRASFPKGSRYMLHISDVPMEHSKIPDDLKPTKTMSMNSWRDGADVVLKWNVWVEDGKRTFDVRTQTEQLFEYEISDWKRPGNYPNEGFDLEAGSVTEFDPSEKVVLSYFGNEKLKRGVILWLEPHAMWKARQSGQ